VQIKSCFNKFLLASGAHNGCVRCSGAICLVIRIRTELKSPNVGYRRNLVIAGRSGERPFTIRFADLRYRALQALGLLSHELRPRKPPEGQLDRGNGNEGGQGLSEGSRNPLQGAALRQLRPNQEKVRSTTQQRGTPYDRQRCSGSIKREAIYTASEDPRYPGPTRAAAGRAVRWRGGCCLPLKGPARASL